MAAGVAYRISPQDFFIPSDQMCKKIRAGIPFLGFIQAYLSERALARAIEVEFNPERLIRLIEVKNEFKVATIINGLLSIALMVGLVAAGILTGGIAFNIVAPLSAAFIFSFGLHQILYNQNVIEDIKLTGSCSIFSEIK